MFPSEWFFSLSMVNPEIDELIDHGIQALWVMVLSKARHSQGLRLTQSRCSRLPETELCNHEKRKQYFNHVLAQSNNAPDDHSTRS